MRKERDAACEAERRSSGRGSDESLRQQCPVGVLAHAYVFLDRFLAPSLGFRRALLKEHARLARELTKMNPVGKKEAT